MSKTFTLIPSPQRLPGDILRGMIVAVLIEVIRHYLRPKDNAIGAIDTAIDAFHGEN